MKVIKLELVGVGRYVKVKSPHNKKVWIDIFFLDNDNLSFILAANASITRYICEEKTK